MGSKLMMVRVAFLVLVAGCTSVGNRIPEVGLPLGPLSTNATYDVIGPTQGTSTGCYILGFIPVGMERKVGVIGGRVFQFRDPLMAAAVYNAIENMPGADALLDPRWEVVSKNYVVYAERTVTVKGKAIRYNLSGL